VDDLLAKTAEVGKNGAFELFKTSNKYDPTARKPDYLNGGSGASFRKADQPRSS